MDEAEKAWLDREQEIVENALENAYRSQINYPWEWSFAEYFDEEILRKHRERDFFLKSYRDQHTDNERIIDRDDIRHPDSISEMVCDSCDKVQFALYGKGNGTYCGSCFEDHDFENQGSLQDFEDGQTYALIGCGADKNDVTGKVAAKNLYSSPYFEKKLAFGEQLCDHQYIVSAKFGLIHPETAIWHYDASINDVDTDQWLDVMESNLREWPDWTNDDEVYVLIGKRYLDAEASDGHTLRGLLNQSPPEVKYPFEQTSGIGKQNQYLDLAVEHGEPVMPFELTEFEDQTALSSY